MPDRYYRLLFIKGNMTDRYISVSVIYNGLVAGRYIIIYNLVYCNLKGNTLP